MANGAVIAKSKAVYGTLLKKEDYENLVHRSSIHAVVSYLKGTPRYIGVFSDSDVSLFHRGQVERVLGRAVFESYRRIRRFSARRDGIMDFYIKSQEARQLAKALVAVGTGKQESFYLAYPDHLIGRIGLSPEALAKAKDGETLLAALGGTIFERPLAPLLRGGELDVNRCIIAVNGAVLAWAFGEIDRSERGKQRERLKSFFLRKADCANVMTCYRLKRFFDTDAGRIKELILPYRYRVKPYEIDEALSAADPGAALMRLLSERCISRDILVDPDLPEIAIARGNYEFFRRRLALTANEAEALYALMILLETEQTNLQKIVEGIHYGMAPQEIEKYIII
ncbi:MAG: V-type ATPase subunit [Bacteroides sp.]|nr:V-type ATPase subunit [Eubacterium sp.]MCM1418517.1 V-type ATPase subunit [Roseburia sp.]MCM1462602.1 V-type ATPase subunit [Bacteroides sp.]